MNTNMVHNILNFIGLLVGAMLTFDWTTLGLTATDAAHVAAAVLLLSNLIKVTINFTRDGASGIMKPQPPVEASPPDDTPAPQIPAQQ